VTEYEDLCGIWRQVKSWYKREQLEISHGVSISAARELGYAPAQESHIKPVARKRTNKDDDVSKVIFGELAHKTLMLLKRDPDKKHILYSGPLPEDFEE